MRKSDMIFEDLATRDAIVATLSRAGWEASRDQIEFERGHWAAYDVYMHRSNGRMNLRLLRAPAADELYLAIDAPRGEGIGLYLRYGDRLEDVLKAIVGFQDKIDETTYRLHIAGLVDACPDVEAGMQDGTRVRLVNTQHRTPSPHD